MLNGSFEEYVECPYEASQIELAVPWYSSNKINGNGDSGDYFHRCAPVNTVFHLPEMNGIEYKIPKEGDAITGIIVVNHLGSNYREYLSVQLSQSLTINTNYRMKFYISAALSPGRKFLTNGLGGTLSSSAPPSNLGVVNESEFGWVMEHSNLINLFGDPIISDSGWVLVQGVYKSLGGEKYITIGNFLNDDQIKYTILNPNGYPSAYYFIDDVSVEEITEPFWQYRDTTIHYGDSVLIGPALTGLDINWYTANDAFLENAPGIYVKPETSRNYIAKEMFNGAETTHLVHVTVLGGVGLVENELENVAVYPNPTNGRFSLRGLFLAKTGIKIYNLAGQCVWVEELNEGINSTEKEINVSLENGVYVLELRNEISGSVVHRKIVVK